MKLRNYILPLVVTMITGGALKAQQAYQTTAKGLQYKIFTANGGEKIKLNDVITFNFIQKTDKDSVIASSYEMGQPVKVQVQPSRGIADLMDFFPLLAKNDSALVKVPVDSIFKDQETQRPAFLPKGSSLVFVIKIENVQSLDEVMAEAKQEMEKLQNAEKAAVDKYVADQHLSPQTTASGLKYIVTKASVKAKPVAGDSVFVNYTGRTIDGKVFDSSVESVAKAASLEQPGREYKPIGFVVGTGDVIPGWDEGLLLLNEGSQAKLIIPSALAYGSRGAGEDIKPFSPLIFDVELVKVKHAPKPETETAPMAPAVKKAPVKKAAPVKPAAKKPVKK